MANRNWSNGGKVMSMHVAPVMITTAITIGATGAVTSFKGSTTLSVVRTGTGLYTITLQPQVNFPTLLGSLCSMQSPVSGLSGISQVEVGNAPNTSLATATGGIISIKTLSPAGALADPASGSVVQCMFICNNSNVVS